MRTDLKIELEAFIILGLVMRVLNKFLQVACG